jgi:2,3-diketo-5-methylthio-1-phosphopentane phosphatase
MALKVFVDFDGTITRQDVGNAFFRAFGGPICNTIVQEYRDEKISAQECFRREVATIGTLDKQDAIAFLKNQPIDESFKQLVAFCASQDIEIRIVSDGLDFYIGEILEAHGVDDVPYFANALGLHSLGSDTCELAISFLHSDAECTRCACCKRNIMLTHAGDDDIIVFIGEGYSDRCPAQYADIVFAKDELQSYCQQENISYFLYSSFADVVDRLKQLLARKSIPKRRRAELKRRELFIRE